MREDCVLSFFIDLKGYSDMSCLMAEDPLILRRDSRAFNRIFGKLSKKIPASTLQGYPPMVLSSYTRRGYKASSLFLRAIQNE